MAGFKVFANNQLLTAAEVNDYLMRQVTPQIPDLAARNAIAAPTQGMRVYRLDTGVEEIYRATYDAVTNPGGALVAGWYPAEQPAWFESGLASGWVTESGAAPGAVRYGRLGRTLIIQPALYVRSGSAATAGSGQSVTISTILTGFRPPATRYLGAGTIGVSGNLGASRWFLQSDGQLFFQSLVGGSSILAGGGVQNNVGHGELRLVL